MSFRLSGPLLLLALFLTAVPTVPAAAELKPPLSDIDPPELTAPEGADPAWAPIGNRRHPDGRSAHLMTWAEGLDRLVMVGGYTSHGLDNDVWTLDPSHMAEGWRRVAVTGELPEIRHHPRAVWDPTGRRLVVYGGVVPDDSFGSCAGEGCAFYGLRFPNDLWELAFDASGTAATWRQLHAGGRVDSDRKALLPSGRLYHGMVYDSKNDRLLIHGGYDQLNHVQAWNAYVDSIQSVVTQRRFFKFSVGDTWAFDLAGDGGWEMLHADGPRRASHPTVYDPVNHQIVITGGSAFSEEPGVTASFDLDTKTWTTWDGAGEVPFEYYDVAYDYSASFGGALFYGPAAWSYDEPRSRSVHGLRFGPDGAGAEWVTLPPRNLSWSPLYGMRAAVLPDGRLYTFGGDLSGSFEPKDALLRSFDPVSRRWHRQPESFQAVPVTFGAASALDPVRHRLYVTGGVTGGGRGSDGLWMLDLATEEWQPIEAGPAPQGPIAVDPSGGRLFTLEGCTERVWTLTPSAAAWTQLTPVGRPPRVCSPGLVFDVPRNRLLLFGGQVHGDMGGESYINTDVFALELGGTQPIWRRLEVVGDAPKPARGNFQQPHVPPVYDPHRDRVLVRSATDTWHAFDMSGARDGSWSLITTQGQGPTGDLLLAFDVANNRLLAYEACDDGATHSLSFEGEPTWSVLEAAGVRVRCGAAAVYDPTRKRLITFGGFDPSTGPPTSTADAFALPLGGSREPSARPTDPYGGPLPGQVALSPRVWQRWGPQHAHTHDVDITPDGSALIASTATTEYEPGAAGIYRAASPAEVWQPAAGDAVGHGMIEIAPAPSDPTTVYATSLSLDYDLRFGTGVYVSHDGGASWTEGGRGLPPDAYWALVVHPRAPAMAWVAGKKGGLFETRDAGRTWTEVARGSLGNFWINSLAVTETTTGIRLLAGLRQQGGTVVGDGGVAYSDDAGRTWEVAFLTEQQAVKALAVDPSNPARVVAAEGYGVWRSDDAGSTWKHVNGRTWRNPTGDDIHLGSIEFDPTSQGRVLYGGGLTYPCDIKDYAPSGAALPPPTPGLFRSDDGGETWIQLENAGEDEFCGLAISDDGRTVIASGLGGGARISTDRGATWANVNDGITQEKVVSAAAHPTDPDIVVAALGPGGVMRTTDGGRTWEQTLGQEGDVGATSVVAVPSKPGRFLLMTTYAVYVSENAGSTWRKTKAPGFGWDFYPSGITPHPTDPDTWYFDATSPTGSGFGVTRDNGATHEFTLVRDAGANRVAACGYSNAVAASDPSRIYMGDACGAGLFRSNDGGVTWLHPNSVLGDAAIASVAVSPTDPNEVWVGTEHRGVWVSRDGGETWRSIYDPLGWEDIRSVAIDPNDPKHVVVSAREVGIFATEDGGATWSELKRESVSHSPWGVQIDGIGRVLAGTATGGLLVAGP